MYRTHRREQGFTLVQVMVAIGIISILCAIAIPAYSRNVRKARESEAAVQLRKLHAISLAYIREESRNKPASFPATQAATPSRSCCEFPGQKCPANPADWDTPTWERLQFSVNEPHWFRYEYESSGDTAGGATATFVARALSDLDCDGNDEIQETSGEFTAEVASTGTWSDPRLQPSVTSFNSSGGPGSSSGNGNGHGNSK